MTWLLHLVLPAILTACAIALLRRSPLTRHVTDVPNERSLHATATPRLGGLGIAAGAYPLMALVAAGPLWVVLLGAVALAALSAIDDVASLPISVRLPAHFTAAALVLLSLGATPRWGWIEASVALLAIAWATNLYNFMDGSDGIAGAMAFVGFATLACAAHASSQPALALFAASIASAAIGFLWFNVPPARVFLGDAGSVPLGFLAAAIATYGAWLDAWPAWFPVLVFSPFVVDATVTLARRAARGERVWIAHRSHFYQRLVLAGWSRRRLLLAMALLSSATSASALAALRASREGRWAIIAAWFVIYLFLAIAIERRARTQGAASPS